jgi:amino acid transporter
VFFFPFSVYLIILGLWWFIRRRQKKLDRKQALYDYIALVATFAFLAFLALLPNQEFLTPFGIRVLVWDLLLAPLGVAFGFLIYLVWPSALESQAENERKEIGTIMAQKLERMRSEAESNRLFDLGVAPSHCRICEGCYKAHKAVTG